MVEVVLVSASLQNLHSYLIAEHCSDGFVFPFSTGHLLCCISSGIHHSFVYWKLLPGEKSTGKATAKTAGKAVRSK